MGLWSRRSPFVSANLLFANRCPRNYLSYRSAPRCQTGRAPRRPKPEATPRCQGREGDRRGGPAHRSRRTSPAWDRFTAAASRTHSPAPSPLKPASRMPSSRKSARMRARVAPRLAQPDLVRPLGHRHQHDVSHSEPPRVSVTTASPLENGHRGEDVSPVGHFPRSSEGGAVSSDRSGGCAPHAYTVPARPSPVSEADVDQVLTIPG